MRTDGPLKVLLIEHESIVALDIETMLEELGCVVVASVPRPRKALDLAFSPISISRRSTSISPAKSSIRCLPADRARHAVHAHDGLQHCEPADQAQQSSPAPQTRRAGRPEEGSG